MKPSVSITRRHGLSCLPTPSLRLSLSLSLSKPRRPHYQHHHACLLRPLSTTSRLSSTSTLTLAIESSCDDTCVAILEKRGSAARLLFNKTITSDNQTFGGVNPIEAVESHSQHLALLVQEALRSLPRVDTDSSNDKDVLLIRDDDYNDDDDDDKAGERTARRKPDFIAATRGPGMLSNLATGLNTAKGLAVAWDRPMVGVHHMQAHTLTPRLVDAMERPWSDDSKLADVAPPTPDFPFLTLLVSGAHTQLVLSRRLASHTILAEAHNIAIGDMLDKCARDIVPADPSAPKGSSFAAALEKFAFPGAVNDTNYDYDGYKAPARRADEIASWKPANAEWNWTLTPPLALKGKSMMYDFAGLTGQSIKALQAKPDMGVEERRALARGTMQLAFEHLASRVIWALTANDKHWDGGKKSKEKDDGTRSVVEDWRWRQKHGKELASVRTLVVSGGVASNRFLVHVLRKVLDVRGFQEVRLVVPPRNLCTDNAAMIAWAGMEMWEEGWRTKLDVLGRRRWSLDPKSEDGGVLGIDGWVRRDKWPRGPIKKKDM